MIHHSPTTVSKMAKLREAMDGADVARIDEAMVGEWKGAFWDIERAYREEMKKDWCSEFGVEFGTVFTPYDCVRMREHGGAVEVLIMENPFKEKPIKGKPAIERQIKETPTKERQSLIEDFFLLE
jgi:hypothetical protein